MMKNLLLVCLLACATPVVAQKKSLGIDSLIKSKSYIVVVNQVTPKPGYVRSANPYPEISNVNPMVSPKVRQEIEAIPIVGSGDYIKQYYNYLAIADAGFSTAFGTVAATENDYAIYCIQDTDKLILNDQILPTTISSIKNSDFSTISNEHYIINTKKKKNGNWELEYRPKRGKNDYPFFLNVTPEGKLVLSLRSGNFYGYIMPNNILKDKVKITKAKLLR